MIETLRIRHDGRPRYGNLASGGLVELLDAAPWEGGERDGSVVTDSGLELLPPTTPGKILAAAVNYHSHAIRRPAPPKPELFFKPSSCLIGAGRPVVLPHDAGRVDAEGELVVVIGRAARRVAPEDALDYVAGYTCGLDISARTWQRADRFFWRAKGADTFGPVGPAVVSHLNLSTTGLVTRINGEVMQEARISDLIFGVPDLVSFASQSMTLEPGDLIFTGTPAITPQIHAGDRIEVEIDGLPVLATTVVSEPAPSGQQTQQEELMDQIEQRIGALGLELPPPRKGSTANIERGVRTGNLLFISGHGPRNKDGLLATGKVGRELSVDEGYELAKHSALGCLRTAKEALGSLEKVRRVVKLMVFINATEDIHEHPKIANGASDLLIKVFGEAGRHARSAMGMASVPLDMPVEIEMVLEVE